MKKVVLVASVAILCTMSSFTSDFRKSISVVFVNPCTNDVKFRYNNSINPVKAGKEYRLKIDEGLIISWEKKGGVNVPIGKVEFDGQQFVCGCE